MIGLVLSPSAHTQNPCTVFVFLRAFDHAGARRRLVKARGGVTPPQRLINVVLRWTNWTVQRWRGGAASAAACLMRTNATRGTMGRADQTAVLVPWSHCAALTYLLTISSTYQ
ncbi:unnamed protein product, partial [Iphiclides podalirius]